MLISLTGLAGAIPEQLRPFCRVPAFTPVLLNITLIAAALVAAPWFDAPVYALAWGVLVAGVIVTTAVSVAISCSDPQASEP